MYHGANRPTAQAVALGAALFAPRPAPTPMIASAWRRMERNTLRGFFSLLLPSGLQLLDVAIHEKDGARWIGLPGRPQIGPDGRQLTTKSGKPRWSPTIQILDKGTRERFQAEALAALDRLLGQGGAAP